MVESQIAERELETIVDCDTGDEEKTQSSNAELEVLKSELAWLRAWLRDSGLILPGGPEAGETQ